MRRTNQVFLLLSVVAVAGLLLSVIAFVAGIVISATSRSLYSALYPFVHSTAPVVMRVMLVAEALALLIFAASAVCWRRTVLHDTRWLLPLAGVLFVGTTIVFLLVARRVIPVPNL